MKKCVDSIFEHLVHVEFEIVIADNHSGDDLEYFRKNKRIKLLELDINYGFAKANNLAFEKSVGEKILFLNPDTEFVDNSIEKLLEFQNQNKKAAIIGCKILNTDGSLQRSVRSFPTLSSHIIILLKIHRIMPDILPLNKYMMKDFDYDSICEVDQVMGAFLLTTKSIFTEIGMFDKNYFIWYEEVDLCKKAIDKGYKVIYNPTARIKHHYSQSFKHELRIRKQILLNKSMRYYFKKNSNLFSYLTITAFSGISLIITSFIKLIFREKVVSEKKT